MKGFFNKAILLFFIGLLSACAAQARTPVPPTPTLPVTLPAGCPPKCAKVDWSGVDFRGVHFCCPKDLSGAKLRGANLSEVSFLSVNNLSEADLSQAVLHKTWLYQTNLSGAKLVEADLNEANLNSADLTGADLRGANLTGVDFYHARLTGADLRGANLQQAVHLAQSIDFFSATIDETTRFDEHWKKILDLKFKGCPGCDLSGINLDYVDLSGADLHGANLSGSHIHDANLSKANLQGVDFHSSIVEGTDFSEADLQQAILPNANMAFVILNGADLTGADLSRAYLLRSKLAGAIFRDANLNGAFLSGSDLKNADLSGANLTGVDFRSVVETTDLSGANLSGADLRGASLDGVNFLEAQIDEKTQFDEKWQFVVRMKIEGAVEQKLDGKDFANANFPRGDFRRASLQRANFRAANLEGTDFEGTDLSGADLSQTNLQGANLKNANLTDAILVYANLSGADLSEAVLSDADLRVATLTTANLARAKLAAADLTGAALSGATLTDADLSGATLSEAQLQQAANRSGMVLSTPLVEPTSAVTLLDADAAPEAVRAEMRVLDAEMQQKYSVVDPSCGSDAKDPGDENANCSQYLWTKYATSPEWTALFPETHFFLIGYNEIEDAMNNPNGHEFYYAVFAIRNGQRYYHNGFNSLVLDSGVNVEATRRELLARAFALMTIGSYLDGQVVFTSWEAINPGSSYDLTAWTENNGLKLDWQLEFYGKCLVRSDGYVAAQQIGNFREVEALRYPRADDFKRYGDAYSPDLCQEK